MDSNQSSGDTGSSERSFAEENMDRTGQAGVEGAFDADPGLDPARRQMQQDAQDAFGGSSDESSGG
jgi:hypothetical protein